MHGIESLAAVWLNHESIVHSFNSIMFNKFFNNQVIRHGHSDCADYIIANVKDATAVVYFKNGGVYRYKNVSRRALIKLIMQPNISLGRWINDALLVFNSKAVMYQQYAVWVIAQCKGAIPLPAIVP